MTAQEIAQFVITTLGDYSVYLVAGVLLGLVFYGLRRFIKSGR